jgi:hypothetical protein
LVFEKQQIKSHNDVELKCNKIIKQKCGHLIRHTILHY